MIAAAFVAHQCNVYKSDQYAANNSPGHIIARSLYTDHFYISEQYDQPDTENGGKEKYYA